MTHTYTNITLVDVEQGEAAEWLAENGVLAAVSPMVDDITVIYENTIEAHADDEEPLEALIVLASEASYELGCIAWLVVVDNDAALVYSLYVDGELIDSYGAARGLPPEGGNAERLADTFGLPKKQIKLIRTLLNRPLNADESASERHAKLVELLALAPIAARHSYATLQAGTVPPLFALEDVIFITAADDDDEDTNEDTPSA